MPVCSTMTVPEKEGPSPMMVDRITPTDASYLQSLEEPWKSIGLKAVPPTCDNLPSAASRVDQLEIDLRSGFMRLFLDDSIENSSEVAGKFWKCALDICFHIVHSSSQKDCSPSYEGISPRKLPFLLIEDCLDIIPVRESKLFWEKYVEPALDETLLGNLMWEASNACHLVFLRVCNHFLRVLERASNGDNQEWKGRILWALSKGFSIADRSALKVWGSFHSSNYEFDSKEAYDEDQSRASSSTASKGQPMDYNLYHAFWSLQTDFSNPNRIQIASFIKKIKKILEAMESSASRVRDKSVPNTTCIKYMTASSLLPTQLSTAAFRSSVNSQFLIIASHLSSESAALAKALAPLMTRAKKLLKADHPELYIVLWDSILASREGQWRQWKKNKSPASAFAPKQKPGDEPAKGKGRNSLLAAGPLGSGDDKKAEHEYESVSRKELMQISLELKKAAPTLESHLEPYVEALDPESGIEAEYHPGNDPLFAWRAMRLYAKHELPRLRNCRRPKDLERITREMYEAQGNRIPGEMPPVEEDSFEEEEEEQMQEERNDDDIKHNEADKKSVEKDDSQVVDNDENEGKATRNETDVKMKDSGSQDADKDTDLSKSKDEDMDDLNATTAPKPATNHSEAAKKGDPNVEKSSGKSESLSEPPVKSEVIKSEKKPNTSDMKVKNEKMSSALKEKVEKARSSPVNETSKEKSEDKGESKKSEVTDTNKSDGKDRLEEHKDKSEKKVASKDEDENNGIGSKARRRDSQRKRKRSTSPENERDRDRDRDRDRGRATRGSSREGDRDHGGRDRRSGHRGGGKDEGPPHRGRDDALPHRNGRDDRPPLRGGRDDRPPPRGGRRYDDGGRRDEGVRRDEGPPPRRGRDGGPPPRNDRRDDGPPPPNRNGRRHDDGPPPRGGRHDGPPPRDGPRGGPRGGPDRRDDRHRGDSGGDRRRIAGRDEGRYRGRR